MKLLPILFSLCSVSLSNCNKEETPPNPAKEKQSAGAVPASPPSSEAMVEAFTTATNNNELSEIFTGFVPAKSMAIPEKGNTYPTLPDHVYDSLVETLDKNAHAPLAGWLDAQIDFPLYYGPLLMLRVNEGQFGSAKKNVTDKFIELNGRAWVRSNQTLFDGRADPNTCIIVHRRSGRIIKATGLYEESYILR